jgi:hypothetical protein
MSSARKARAGAEIFLIGAIYILVSNAAVNAVEIGFLFPASWSLAERATGGGFLTGAVVQLLLILFGAYLFRLPDMKRAIAASLTPSNRKGWTIAAIATSIHIGTALLLFVPQPQRIWQISSLNLILSAIPAADGWSQEIFFRGYVLYRLERARIPALAQILTSGSLFAAIHLGYVGENAWSILTPLLGTFMLGCFYAWAVQRGRGSLKPVICCHSLIIVILQPWLALAY